MKILNILIALIILFSVSCTSNNTMNEDGTEEHGHSHDGGLDDHGHEHDEPNEQEEFTIESDSIQVETDTTSHTHEDGSKHQNH